MRNILQQQHLLKVLNNYDTETFESISEQFDLHPSIKYAQDGRRRILKQVIKELVPEEPFILEAALILIPQLRIRINDEHIRGEYLFEIAAAESMRKRDITTYKDYYRLGEPLVYVPAAELHNA